MFSVTVTEFVKQQPSEPLTEDPAYINSSKTHKDGRCFYLLAKMPPPCGNSLETNYSSLDAPAITLFLTIL